MSPTFRSSLLPHTPSHHLGLCGFNYIHASTVSQRAVCSLLRGARLLYTLLACAYVSLPPSMRGSSAPLLLLAISSRLAESLSISCRFGEPPLGVVADVFSSTPGTLLHPCLSFFRLQYLLAPRPRPGDSCDGFRYLPLLTIVYPPYGDRDEADEACFLPLPLVYLPPWHPSASRMGVPPVRAEKHLVRFPFDCLCPPVDEHFVGMSSHSPLLVVRLLSSC